MRCLRQVLVALPLLAVLCSIAPGTAGAAPGSPYGHLTITYRNASTYKWQVTEAFAVWNRAGTPYRFVPAKPRTRADITVTQKPYIGSPNSSIAGFGGVGFVQLSVARLKSPKVFHNGQVKIVAHEIGHAMGLGHSRNTCALMYSAADYPGRPACTTPQPQFDARQHCGPRTVDLAILARQYRFTLAPKAGRGDCVTPTDQAKAATGPFVAGTLTAAATQDPWSTGGVQLTLTNTGNVEHELGSLGIVAVDANGTIMQNPWRFNMWYQAVVKAPAPGQSSTVVVPPCNGTYPVNMRLRLASQHHDALLSPEVVVRIDTADGDPAAPASECVNLEPEQPPTGP